MPSWRHGCICTFSTSSSNASPATSWGGLDFNLFPTLLGCIYTEPCDSPRRMIRQVARNVTPKECWSCSIYAGCVNTQLFAVSIGRNNFISLWDDGGCVSVSLFWCVAASDWLKDHLIKSSLPSFGHISSTEDMKNEQSCCDKAHIWHRQGRGRERKGALPPSRPLLE